MPSYVPDPRHTRLGDALYDVVRPAAFPALTLRWRNDRAAATVGLDTLGDAAWIDHMARFKPLPGNLPEPLALRYHGHQFRHYNPDLGDGRGFLFAQLRDAQGRLLDLGTKGSGTTPWSRGGDGRLTLQGGVREVLAAELLEAQGVPTCRILSLVETGEDLVRHDEPSPTRASVMVRLSWSHVRFGTFQRLAQRGEVDSMIRLIEYSLETYYPGIAPGPDPALTLFTQVVARSAKLVAAWLNAGFVHGVLNTDNLVITGESFDYGPWRFAPTFDPQFTAAYFDQEGLYAFGRQPEAVAWGLERLAEALSLAGDAAALEAVMETYIPAFRKAWRECLLTKLGIALTNDEIDESRLRDVVGFLYRSQMPLEQFFVDWRGGAVSRERALTGAQARFYASEAFAPVAEWLPDTGPSPTLTDAHGALDAPVTMLIEEVRSIWAAIADRDDWAPFHAKVAAVRAYGKALGHTP